MIHAFLVLPIYKHTDEEYHFDHLTLISLNYSLLHMVVFRGINIYLSAGHIVSIGGHHSLICVKRIWSCHLALYEIAIIFLRHLKKPYKHLTLSHLATVQYLSLSTPKNPVRNNSQRVYLSTCGQGTFRRNTVQILYVKNLLKEQISSVCKIKKARKRLDERKNTWE